MRRLLAWVSSFTRNDQIVNQAVRQLTEIARERVNSSAGIHPHAVAQGYQRARLRQTVREYLESLDSGRREVSPARRRQLIESIVERLIAQDLIQTEASAPAQVVPRKAA
ncbi:hypothetical protein Pan97_21760 [Bremerella volcania]|uniref:Uncharacterized protein n=1 Tax=Bremerella volcania TaxID=2527984 RepID=A0A518C7F0_9BACT|nr:hypothetical protein [Bremerella volcania]QDU75153.1 hypothetical protein Pan97_21760 [Bremerella volcania]